MLACNLRTTSFAAAFQRTFDGKHPCALCKAVAQARKSEKKSDTLFSLKKFEALNQAVAVLVSPPASFPAIEAQAKFFAALAHAPPTPPPRAA